MKILIRLLRSLKIDSGAHRRWVGERQAGAARLWGAEGANDALKTAYWTLAVVLALSSSWVHAQIPTCVAPGCNPVASDDFANTAMGRDVLTHLITTNGGNDNGAFNTAAGYRALASDTIGEVNTALGDGALASNTTGSGNTASGGEALFSNTTGGWNTASGINALFSNTTGGRNTASGLEALYHNTTGFNNTASGFAALYANTTGSYNVAVGDEALSSNTTVSGNTASGYRALTSNTIGASNAAFGASALQYNVEGNENTASGAFSLYFNTSGNYNAASGFQALYANTTASRNTASGYRALYFTTTGARNTAIGFRALIFNTTGQDNIGIGNDAGYAVTGSNNIDIGNQGFAADAGTIRIGAPSTQSKAFIAGIHGTPLTGSAVYVTSSGQLGVLGSSERFKTDIAPMPELSDKIKRLRPVTFRYKTDPQAIRQYGLIAEEVDQVYPELVIRDEAGKIQGVRYEELAPMLLNEVQQQAAEIRDLKKLVVEMQAGLLKLQAKDELVTLQLKDQLVAQR